MMLLSASITGSQKVINDANALRIHLCLCKHVCARQQCLKWPAAPACRPGPFDTFTPHHDRLYTPTSCTDRDPAKQ